MHDVDPTGLIAFFAAMALAGALPALLPRLPVPGVVFEIAFGVLLGPQVLGIGNAGPVVSFLADLGLAMLFLMAGFEVDPQVLKGRPIRRATLGWFLSAGIAAACVFPLAAFGLIEGPWLTSLALTTTAIGMLLPILRDGGLLAPPYGPAILAAGALGEAGPLIALSLVVAGSQHAQWQALVLCAFATCAVLAVTVAARTSEGPLARAMARGMGMSGQFPLRLTILVMVIMSVLAHRFGMDLVLGAFVAGAVARAAIPHVQHDDLMARLDGVGFGFLVPIFFVTSGLRLDVASLVSSPRTLALVPMFALLMLAARGLPALLLHRQDLDVRHRAALALHSGTQLPLVVAISTIAVQGGAIQGSQGAALVGAGVLTVLLFPTIVRTFVLPPAPRETTEAA